MIKQYLPNVLIIGGGPTGLLLGCLLCDQGVPTTIVEKRPNFTRTRHVKLIQQILQAETTAHGIHLFCDDQIRERKEAIQYITADLRMLIARWIDVCTPLQTIQEVLKYYYTSLGGVLLSGSHYDFSENLDSLQHYPDTFVIDCTGYHSVLRDHIQPNNCLNRVVEWALICTFIFDDIYECNELCKYYKNRNTRKYRIIPAVENTYITGERRTHVTCVITIDETTFEKLSKIKPLTYDDLRTHEREIFDDLNIFLKNLSGTNTNKVHFDTMEFLAIPLQLYRAKKMTHMVTENDINQYWMLMGDAAMGAPYFQSISLGFEAAIYFALIFQKYKTNIQEMLTKYEEYVEKLWLDIQIRSMEIQRNKEILQALGTNNPDGVLNSIKIY